MTDILTDEQVAEIEQRANKATRGPWSSYKWARNQYQPETYYSSVMVSGQVVEVAHQTEDQNADFIAHAREDVPNLIATLRHVQAESDMYRTSAQQWMSESSLCEEENARLREIVSTLNDNIRQALAAEGSTTD